MIKLEKQEYFDIINKYGSPLYIFDEVSFTKNYKHLLDSFRQIYPKYNIAYSYKTNYTPYICKLVKQLGGYAEVVSSMEYWLAKKIGYKSKNIIFNGPIKGELIFQPFIDGGVINIDNLDELDNIIMFSKISPTTICDLAFRVNIDIEQSFISRFGIDADNGDLEKAFNLVKENKNLRVVGLHCHIGRSRSLLSWQNRVNRMFELVDKFFDRPPRFIDLGSGMCSEMEPELAKQFGDNIPTYEDYAQVVAKPFAEKFGKLSYVEMPELITEPGTTLISGYISFLALVKSIKQIKGKTFATLDGSIGNMGDICRIKQLPISVISNREQQDYNNVDFVGYTCLEHDVMYKNYSGPLACYDLIEFRNVGGYSNVFKPPFIAPNCAMITVDNTKARLIKDAESYDYIFKNYFFLD